MNRKQLMRRLRAAIFTALIATLLSAFAAQAQGGLSNLRVNNVGSGSATLEWDAVPGVGVYNIFYLRSGGQETWVDATSATSYTLRRLKPSTAYRVKVDADGATSRISFRTRAARVIIPFRYSPPDVTCPHLPAGVIVTGYIVNTQCQMVDESSVGRMDVIKRGVVHAVDVWNAVPEDIEVCFHYHGWMVFLDADYAPRMMIEMEHYHRDGWTCGSIDRAGTVAMLRTAPPPVTSQPAAGSEETLPIIDAVPLTGCHIKLVETLYLRATPGGEIIDIVWQHSEVPAFEILGFWYKVEFEGNTGYISRYHRKVLRGGCG